MPMMTDIQIGSLRASFQNFLEGITGLSQTIDENINRTFELTQQHLDEFQNAQLETASGDEIALEV